MKKKGSLAKWERRLHLRVNCNQPGYFALEVLQKAVERCMYARLHLPIAVLTDAIHHVVETHDDTGEFVRDEG